MAADVRLAALDAFIRFPDAVEHVEMLTAYFKDSRLEDNGFYAPRGQRKFFEDLEDTVSHAERWRKWAGWKPKKKATESHRKPDKGRMETSEGTNTTTDTQRFLEDVKKSLGMDSNKEGASNGD